ncbi:MAG: glycosyl hydrolase-related protein [Chloroflexota bacterium]
MKRVYVAPDDHTDYMWTADEQTHRQVFLEMLDFYLDQADATDELPSHQQSSWNCEGSLWLWVYQKNRSAAAFERLIARIEDGHITVPLTPLLSCYGGMPAEAILRSMYYAGSVERRYGVRLPLALGIESKTLPYGLGALFAGAGARYCWHAIGEGGTPLPGHFDDREHPLYWWVGPDGSRLLVKWYPRFRRDVPVGSYYEARKLNEALELVESAPWIERYPYDIVGLFGYGEDDLKTLSTEWSTAARELSNDQRQVIVSNEVDFFQDVEQTYGDVLPQQACSFGNDWDLWSATMSEDCARIKRAVEQLRSAEALTTLVSLHDPDFLQRGAAADVAAREQAWLNLGLYYEHNWITSNSQVPPAERVAWQRRVADQVERYVTRLYDDASSALGHMIDRGRQQLPPPQHSRFYVFNPLSWQRTDVADLRATDVVLSPRRPSEAARASDVHVIDLTTGAETPSQFVTVNGLHCLRILATDVPPVGYKVFEIRPGKGTHYAPAAQVRVDQRLPPARGGPVGVLENEFYRFTMASRGAITSLVDKQRCDRDYVDRAYGRGLNDLGFSEGTLVVENEGPVSVTLRATAPLPLEHTSRITLIRDSRCIDIRNDIEQNFDAPQTWTFAFKTDSPELWHEEVGAVIRAKLLDDGGHYSPRNARYDWLTLNHFADVGGDGPGVTLANADCAFMRFGNSTMTQLDTSTPRLSVLAGGNVAGVDLKIRNQGGATHFLQRFAVQTRDAVDPLEAMKFALEHQNPLVAAEVTRSASASSATSRTGGGGALPEQSFSLLAISNPNVLLWALKPAEEGMSNGIIARVWNLSTQPQDFSLSLASGISHASRVSHIETDLADAIVSGEALSASIAPSQLATFRVVPGAGPPTTTRVETRIGGSA